MLEDAGKAEINGLNKRLDILIALYMRAHSLDGSNQLRRNISAEAIFLTNFGLTYEEISKITGSTRESVTELVGKARRSAAKKSPTKKSAKGKRTN